MARVRPIVLHVPVAVARTAVVVGVAVTATVLRNPVLTRWLWALFGVALTAGGVVALVHPVSTFAGLAEIIGVIFLVIGMIWMFQSFAERAFNSLWWLNLVSGIVMIVLAFWTTGEFFVNGRSRCSSSPVCGP